MRTRQLVQTAPAKLSFTPLRGGLLQRKCACRGTVSPTGECAECSKKKLQRKSRLLEFETKNSSPLPAIVYEVLRSPGQALDPATRAFMEPRFDRDFSRVRIHTDARAAESAAAIDANAFTVGRNIVFGTANGSALSRQRLLGHELAHVVQQEFANPASGELVMSTDTAAEEQAESAAARVAVGTSAGKLTPNTQSTAQREEGPKPPAAKLNWWQTALVETAAAPALTMGSTVHEMVKATLRGLILEVKAEAETKGDQFWTKVKEALGSPSQAASFVLHYWWGLVKGIFSPITGLFDLAKLIVKLQMLQVGVMGTAWARRNELAADAGKIAEEIDALGRRGRDAISGFKAHPLETVKALGPWFSSLEKDAIGAAESGGHKAGGLLMAQLDKPLPEIGENAGEIVGTVLINIVLLVFTDGIGNAITQVASKLGELGSFLGKFGKAAEMLGALAGQIGELLGSIGGWIAKAEAAFAKVAETVLKPLAPLLEELGKLMGGLRSFLRKLLGASEEAASVAGEGLAGAGARNLEGHLPASGPAAVQKPPVTRPTAKTPSVAEGAEFAPPKTTPPTSSPPPAKHVGTAPRAKVFEGISQETEELLARRPGLARALNEHPEAGDLFKLCKSECFPSFMTDEEIVERLLRLERMQKEAARYGIDFKRGPTKELLHKQKTVMDVDSALDGLEDILRQKLRQVWSPASGGEPPGALSRAQPKVPPRRPQTKPSIDDPTPQFENLPDQLPSGHEDFFDAPGASKTKTPGGKAERSKTFTGKWVDRNAELLQNHPKVLEDLGRRAGSSRIFNRRLPEGLTPEYRIPHPDYPPGMKPRIDRLWRRGNTIFELKPNTLSAERGMAQAQQYAEWMDRFEPLGPGQTWRWEVVEYDQTLLMEYLKEIGVLP